MKKIALVLTLLLVIGMTGVFAEVGVYVGGQAKTEFIFDLDDNGYAMKNGLYAEVNLSFGEAIDRSGEGDVYGEISVSNLAFSITNAITAQDYAGVDQALSNFESGGHWSQDPVWTAKIIAGDFYVKVDGNEKIRARRDVMANVLDDFSLISLNQYGSFASATIAGTAAVGYSIADTADITVKFGTENNAPTVGNAFGLAADVSVTAVENMNLDLSYVFANTAAGANGFGVTAGYDVAVDTMTVTPYAGFDMDFGASTYEVGGGVKVAWESDKGGVVNDAAGAWKGFFGAKTWVDAGADLAVKYTSAGVVDLLVTAAYFPVEKLNSALLFEMTDLLGTSAMGLGAYADYKEANVFKAYGWLKYTTAADFLLGAEYLGIANTAIGAKYVSADNAVTAYCTVSAW